jgi:hypothetical protein
VERGEAVSLLEGAYQDVSNLEVDEDDPIFPECRAAALEVTSQVRPLPLTLRTIFPSVQGHRRRD